MSSLGIELRTSGRGGQSALLTTEPSLQSPRLSFILLDPITEEEGKEEGDCYSFFVNEGH